jgi:L-threonylcarbamoyladenylate synthase
VIVPASDEAFHEAAKLLQQGGLIAFPTETYYGLGVDPFNAEALQRLFAIKRRAENKPVLVLVKDQEQVSLLAETVPAELQHLMNYFWPGPLTLVCPARAELPKLLTGGTNTVGIRQSPDATARFLLAAFGRPITATSANRSGELAAVTAAEVEVAFNSEIDLIIDSGRTPGGAGSSLVGYDEQGLRCVREGRISFAKILRLLATKESRKQEKHFFSSL